MNLYTELLLLAAIIVYVVDLRLHAELARSTGEGPRYQSPEPPPGSPAL